MSGEIQIPPTPAPDYWKEPAPDWVTPLEATERELNRYADQLVPGAAAEIAKTLAGRVGTMAPDRRAEEVARYLQSGLGKRYLDPEASVQTLSPIRAAISRYSADLKDGAVDQLVATWSADLARRNLSPIQLAGEVSRRLGKPESQPYLTRPIDRRYDQRIPASVAAGKAARAETEREAFAAEKVATEQSKLGKGRMERDEKGYLRWVPAEPVRQADGRFAGAPSSTTPPIRKPQSGF
jgi:hypothetical protein